MRGFVLTALSRPDLAKRHVRTGAFGTTGAAEWSRPALGITAVALSFLEPDPQVEWDAERLAQVRQMLEP